MRQNPDPSPWRRLHRTVWASLLFLAGFAVLIALISHWYLIPALSASQEASTGERRQLAATSRLMLAVVLVILLAGLLLTFRIGRFFLPRTRPGRDKTDYV